MDGLTSIAVLAGAIGVWLGFPLADPIVGLVISAAILRIVWESGKSVLSRLLDGVEPGVVEEVEEVAIGTPGVEEVGEVRVRWLGHELLAEVNIAVDAELSVETGHRIAQAVHNGLLERLQYLSNATIHVDPVGTSGEEHHRNGLNGNNQHDHAQSRDDDGHSHQN